MPATENHKLASAGPAIILVEPQLGENIGMVARAMANFGLAELRLVNPRDHADVLAKLRLDQDDGRTGCGSVFRIFVGWHGRE